MEEQTLILCLCGSLSATVTWPPSYAEMGSVWSIKEGVVMIFGDGRHCTLQTLKCRARIRHIFMVYITELYCISVAIAV